MERPINEVEVEVIGRRIKDVSARRPGISIDVFPKLNFEGDKILGYEIIVDFTSIRDLPKARMEMDPYTLDGSTIDLDGERLHLFHLFVPEDIRGRGIGTVLMNVFKQYAEKASFPQVSASIRNGDTKNFFKSFGINEKYIHIVGADGDQFVLITDAGGTALIQSRQIIDQPAEKAQAINGVPTEKVFR